MATKQPIQYLQIAEFLEGGYLHEINRLLLHPVGLAMQISHTDEDSAILRVWDCREDPEGVYFDESTLSADKAKNVLAQVVERRGERIKKLGYVVQPIRGEKVLILNYTDPDSEAKPPITQGEYEFEQ